MANLGSVNQGRLAGIGSNQRTKTFTTPNCWLSIQPNKSAAATSGKAYGKVIAARAPARPKNLAFISSAAPSDVNSVVVTTRTLYEMVVTIELTKLGSANMRR